MKNNFLQRMPSAQTLAPLHAQLNLIKQGALSLGNFAETVRQTGGTWEERRYMYETLGELLRCRQALLQHTLYMLEALLADTARWEKNVGNLAAARDDLLTAEEIRACSPSLKLLLDGHINHAERVNADRQREFESAGGKTMRREVKVVSDMELLSGLAQVLCEQINLKAITIEGGAEVLAWMMRLVGKVEEGDRPVTAATAKTGLQLMIRDLARDRNTLPLFVGPDGSADRPH